VTFNYDTLLEEALTDVLGTSYSTIDDYLAPHSPTVLKPHGSINWSQRVEPPAQNIADLLRVASQTNAIENALLDQLPSLVQTDEIETDLGYLAMRAVRPHLSTSSARFALPAIAIPFDSKQNFVFPRDHLETLKTVAAKTSHVVVIGWRGTETHFTEVLVSGFNGRRVTGTIVNGSQSESAAAADHLRSSGLRVPWDTTSHTFTEFVQAGPDILKPILPFC
jgi:hypothetical protein